MMNKASQKTESDSNLTMAERSDLSPASRSGDGVVYPRRRQLLTGSIACAGVLLAIQAKTALGAARCQSPSAKVSGNLSNPHVSDTCWGGHPPSYWKQPMHFGEWHGLSFPTFNGGIFNSNSTGDCATGNKQILPCDLATRGTLLSSPLLFVGAPSLGVWEVLVWPTQYPGVTDQCHPTGFNSDPFGENGPLLRTLVAAYLNAGASTNYPIRTDQIIAMWNAVKGGVGVYYPSGNAGNGLDKDGVMGYIQGMYAELDIATEGCGNH